MYENNSIIQSFITNLQAKGVFSVSPDKNCQPNKKITITYKDGSYSELTTDLSHDDFMKEWRMFCEWSQNIHQAQANYIEDWTE